MSIESRSRQYGRVFEHWQIKEFLGSGSGGKTAVFRLTRIDSSRGVSALKIVNLIEERGSFDEISDFRRQEYQAAREECSRSAEQEVWLMDELRGNTNIVDYLDHTFVDWSEEDSFGRDLLIRMELLTDLRSELRNGRMFTEAEVLKIGRDICIALELCHNKNILHRDVKPENIFRNKDGAYKLGDFGVSRVLDACPGAVASTGIGTYEYWPAEQMTGSYDKRVDIYSLGLVLYELSNRNRLPFASSTYVTGKEVSLRLSGAPMTEPTEVSQALARVILKACAFRAADRYQSAEDFMKALDWLSRKNQPSSDISAPKSLRQEVPSVRYETIPARPSDAPNTAFETQPALDWEPAFETQITQSGKSINGSHVKDQNSQKKKKNGWIPVFLTVLMLCGAAGVFAASGIWARNRSASIDSFPEENLLQDEISEIAPSEEQHDNLPETETSTTTETDISTTEPDQKNIVVVKKQLDIFESPRTNSHVMAQLNAGEEVEILQVKSFGTVSWTYVSSSTQKVMGWIVTDMLDMDEMQLFTDNTDSINSPGGATLMDPKYGVITASEANIRSTPSQGAERVGVYVYGDRITILETSNGWARTDQGWVSLSYVYMDGEVGLNAAYGTVTSDLLMVFSGPGSNYSIVNTLYSNDRVQILEQIMINNIPWGCIEGGWVCLNCIQLSSSSEGLAAFPAVTLSSPYRSAIIVGASSVNVRNGPGTSYEIVGTLKNGTNIRVYETETNLGVNWARIDNGWVSMDYVRFSLSEISTATVPTSAPATIPATESLSDSITGIQVSPRKKTLCKGDALTQDNLTVKAVYQSGKTEALQTGFSVSPSMLNTSGTQTVTVSYGGFTESVDVEVIEITKYSLNFSESGSYKHGDVHWMLSVEMAYIGNHRNAGNQYRVNGTMRMDGGPNGDLWEEAKKGKAIGMLGEVYPWDDEGVSEYTTYSTYVLPDDPSFGGKHSITVSIGDVKKTVNFTLTYAGDYNTGTGWELSDVIWT